MYGNINFHINRVDCRVITLPSGIQSKSIDNLYMGVLPIRVYMAIVASANVNANIIKNPYNFSPFNISHIQLSSNIHTNLRPIKINVGKKEYLGVSLFESSNIKFSDAGNTIKRDEFLNGNFICGWDLTHGR